VNASNGAGIALRYDGANGTFYFAQIEPMNGKFRLYRFDGTYSLLAETNFASSGGVDYELVVTAAGSTITATVDGGHEIGSSSCTENPTSTLVGLRADHTGCRFADFQVRA